MVPVNEDEATIGKKYSCTCGGGGDYQSLHHCDDQGTYMNEDGTITNGGPTTYFDWIFYGDGSEESPGTIALRMNAGIKTRSWESVPGQVSCLTTEKVSACTVIHHHASSFLKIDCNRCLQTERT